ncbi:peroxidase family protein [Cellulomonas aerilata]|uniref:SbsA Ig-like domain-containing protein n=1 Tax=Cellulomonas aerilata TaxID=515326 RepID=A0A512D759_9CELL|nr:peroxidase family protein [Cellulomonas aerilata]GEO32312.1 hypothetical protein CAE01nite_00370 [Cellulomonas aerilata]
MRSPLVRELVLVRRAGRFVAAAVGAVVGLGTMSAATLPAAAAPVGQGFNLNASDLRFILKQIKIAERHADTLTPANQCGTLMGTAADQIPPTGAGPELPWGLRTIDGTCNNLITGQSRYGTADQRFPRIVPKSLKGAEGGDLDGSEGSIPPIASSSYVQTSGNVLDSQPRIISNLIVDQTASNPAAVDAAAATDELDDPAPPVADPQTGAYFIPNTAPDVGLSAPYNSWFTLFGQFFDHGLDLVNKGGVGTVFVPLQPADKLYNPDLDGPDNIRNTADDPPNFMVLTRATHSGDHEATNQTSPFIDQSQTYTSHPSHQVFLRKYVLDAVGDPQPSGALLTAANDGMATWADVKSQAATVLGIQLSDADVLNVPLLATDPYGRFARGENGFPQLVVPGAPGGLVEGNPAAPVTTTGATKSGHAFLDDIAHHAVPGPVDHDLDPTTPRVPAQPDTDAGTADDRNGSTYDDEMLNAHYVAGDGRVNENIGLTAVHHVFHSEHNRLVEYIDAFVKDPALMSEADRADWNAVRYAAVDGSYTYGERLFQAARFVTEMEYQHLAFEEFARKVQPLVNPFGEGGTGYNTSINPAIKAEFAHAVYRFGHSMLNESVDRVNPVGTRSDIDLLQAFLNPPSFTAGGLSPDQAAGNIVRGMTRQVGNELDEFTTEALRNRLLGLPLDLATLNITRARETGVPTLNNARKAFYEESNNSALAPYQSWADFSFSLKHSSSLNNFIAAYGKHPTITSATTVAAKRAAADALVFGANGRDTDPNTADDIANVPADRYAFLNSAPHEVTDPETGVTTEVNRTWVTVGGASQTGVDDIDLWVGGLAEKQMVFGGLLGPTFNYVFEDQMEDLQFGDRFYYLSRTAGLNLLTQLEGNSFSELIQRTTDVSGLPADSFSRPALVFDIANLGTSGPVLDDPATPFNEGTLTRMPDGTIRYGGVEHVVFNGTDGNDRVWSSEGDDTIRGNDGNDWMQGGDGNDNHIGGLGDDILLDSNGDDVLKGGDGNDTLSSGQGFGGDLNQSGRGNDFVVTGNDMAETFAGAGDDYVTGGAGDDTVFGDDGDDWIESGASVTGTGGGAFNLLQGDNGAPFQDDPNEPGHDVLIGYGGETDYDAEGGDDVMLLGPGIQRSEGMLGFDFATHESDPVAGNSDMDLSVLLPPSVETNRDRFDAVESLSGFNLNDVLKGDDRDAAAMEDHQLTAAGIARVAGLAGVLPPNVTSFTGGNILMGGAGSDSIEGRGGDDVIDGDAYLNVRISVRNQVAEPSTQVETFERMRDVQARVLSGEINPGRLRVVREVLTPTDAAAVDTAVFSGPLSDYTITAAGGVATVAHDGGAGVDGTDTLRRVERLQFTDQTIDTPAVTEAPTVTARTPVADATNVVVGNNVTATFSEAVQGVSGTSFTLRAAGAAADVPAAVTYDAATRVATLNPTADLAAGTQYTATLTGGAAAIRDLTNSPLATTTWTFTTAAPVDTVAPTVTARVPAINATGVAVAADLSATFSEAVQGVTPTTFTLRQGSATGTLVPATVTQSGTTNQWILNPNANLAANTQYTVTLDGGTTAIRDNANLALTDVTWSFTTAAAGGSTRTLTLDASADTFVNQSAPTATSGGATTLNVDSEFTPGVANTRTSTYVRFTIPALAAGETITAANLSLNVTNITPDGPQVWRTNPVWTEGTMTWNTGQPGRVGTAAVGNFGNVPLGRVTTPVTGVTTAGDVSFQLFADSTDGVQFDSRETANDPRLVLTITGGTAPVDTVAPTVTARVPAINATGVAVAADLSATFSEAVQGVTPTTFTLRQGSATGTLVPATVTQSGTTNQWILNPNANLAANTQYTVTLDGGTTAIRDNANLALTDVTWSFTTAAAGGTRTLTLDASADTWVQQGLPTTASGGATTLNVDSEFTGGNAATRTSAYVRFTIPALAAGETITAANLSLNVTNNTPDGPQVWRTNPVWTEGTMTWNTGQPGRVGTAAVGNFGNVPLGRVSTPVTGVTTAGDVSFQLFADSTDGVQFDSRETANDPRLVLTIRTP